MFTGLVETVGRTLFARNAPFGMELEVDLGSLADGVGIGDSVSLSGVCCTVVGVDSGRGRFDLSIETLSRTWFRTRFGHGTPLNLERCVPVGGRLGGHIVQGHVDGVGSVVEPVDPARGGDLVVVIPDRLARYCVEKGSIAIDGVSLTPARVTGSRITCAIIPHTAASTTIGGWRAGDPVHIEVDVLAKYVERLLGLSAGS
jgi:riboflavin synthase